MHRRATRAAAEKAFLAHEPTRHLERGGIIGLDPLVYKGPVEHARDEVIPNPLHQVRLADLVGIQ